MAAAARLRGQPYDDLVDEFVRAVRRRFPKALLQWEDFKQWNAFRLLDRYRSELPSFNDDIQGTAAMALAGLLAGGRATGLPLEKQRIVMVGAGAAGTGIARLIRAALLRAGVRGDDLLRALALVDMDGLVVDSDIEYRRGLSWPGALAERLGLGPGAPGPRRGGARPRADGPRGRFRRARRVHGGGGAGDGTARGTPAPLPALQPDDERRGDAPRPSGVDGGRALVATGSPFGSVEYGGRTVRIGQGNNVFVFPGVGLGMLVAEAREVTDAMFASAAETLAAAVEEDDLREGALYPKVSRLRQVTARVAEAVVREARDRGVGRPFTDAEIAPAVAAAMWDPQYPELVSDYSV